MQRWRVPHCNVRKGAGRNAAYVTKQRRKWASSRAELLPLLDTRTVCCSLRPPMRRNVSMVLTDIGAAWHVYLLFVARTHQQGSETWHARFRNCAPWFLHCRRLGTSTSASRTVGTWAPGASTFRAFSGRSPRRIMRGPSPLRASAPRSSARRSVMRCACGATCEYPPPPSACSLHCECWINAAQEPEEHWQVTHASVQQTLRLQSINGCCTQVGGLG
jgi:hypothetical protein